METASKLIVIYRRHPLLPEYNYKNITLDPTQAPEALALISESDMNEVEGPADEESNSTISSIINAIASNFTEATVTDPRDRLLLPSDDVGPLNQPNTALFCMCLTLGTFALAYYLKLFRNSKFLGRNARRALGNLIFIPEVA